MVDKSLFASVVTELEPIVSSLADKNMQPTEFEVITAAAFMIFERSGCDICVLEVGLGGRLDSTNVIPTPLVSAIVSISLDHTAILDMQPLYDQLLGNVISDVYDGTITNIDSQGLLFQKLTMKKPKNLKMLILHTEM
jgi:hypothetical protein